MVRKSPRVANPTVRAAVHLIILSSAAALLPAPRADADPPPNDPCTTSTNVLFCAGNQSNGISVQGNPNLLYLFIQPHTLTQNITPAPGVGGISFTGFLSDGLFLDMNDGVASVSTTGDNANALTVQTNGQLPRSFNAGDASVLNADVLSTTGVHSSGIYAESLASHTIFDLGLTGGFVLAQTSANITTYSTDPNAQSYGIFAHSFAIYSAPASVAEIEDDGAQIQTFGGGSAAIFASSEGGYGANGSSGLSGSSGSPGGTGGPVEILGSGTLLTSGDNAQGILAVSRGGIGGSGGDGYLANAGNGVFGGAAGALSITGNWTISTLGNGSDGIRAESLGGEGGSGGEGYTFGSGGGGGGSGYAADVIVNVTGRIVTYGDTANGIIAQSIGGFAGNGGNSYGLIAYGGSGESAGHGGNVTVTNGAQIFTFGQYANGIVAQSIGGGGGSGGSGGAIYALGGSGAAGGAGESVTVLNTGAILANGVGSRGIYAQSIGGGGGDGGDSGGLAAIGGSGASTDSTGGSVTVKNTAASASIFSYSNAIFAESVGGGGGSGGSSTGWVSVGGGGGSGGDAGAVIVVNAGQLTSIDDNASAIFAHSIGGSGGNGGSAVSGSIGGASFAIGGSGAQAGNSELVQVTNSGDITTGDYHFTGGPSGDNSSGIFAQSIGGGGGNGGFAAALSAGGAGTSLAIGGAASVGGYGNRVILGNSGNINTAGDNSSGIAAESIGGGGGTGGFAIALSAGVAFSGAAAIGGSGAGGGDSLNGVSVTNSGNLATLGDHSYGLLAQSVGGGGGNGGFAIAGTFSVSGAAAALSLGGSGGGGGGAAAVNVLSNGSISTVGNDSTGLLAESIGGGGGSGGFAISASISGGVAADVALGGTGAGGGAGSTVSVGSTTQYTSGLISTAGNNSAGLIAQSIGGGGGNGGFSVAGDIGLAPSAQLAMGGAGGMGNDGDAVSVYSGNSVITRGNDSYGILAQSVGGGGGNGGFAVAGSINLSGGNLGIAMGGNGSYGGDAAGVTLFSTGNSISTTGARSDGLVAQSVGGGGGDGGFSVAADVSAGASANLSLGGSADHGGIANAVVLNSSTSVTTSGDDSHAVLAQSVGGGGGSGGFAIAGSISAGVGADLALGGGGGGGGASSTVNVGSASNPLSGTLITAGARSDGLLAQSVGGGGGDGGFSVAGSISAAPALGFSLGGSGSAGAAANTVTVYTSSSVATQGEDSHGIVVQSVGGGGGTGGFSVAGSASGSSASAAASIGGPGGAGGDGAAVWLTSSGAQVVTAGAHAYGILVQSVGGGGGDGGFSVAGSFSATGTAAALSLGGAGLTGGIGAAVTVNSTTNITTLGAGSIGLFAQSLGGGGGDGGFSVAGSLGAGSAADVSIGGKGSGGGAAGAVTVGTALNPDAGTILTAGGGAVGLLAQSIGGGGGNGGFSVAGSITQSPSAHLSIGGAGGTGSDAGAVTVFTANSIMTQGADASGLFAQSLGGGGGNGGFSVAGSINASGASAGVSIGGAGNGGGDAKAVSVDSSGAAIVTQGDRSFGLVAQSVGGGGGDGGFSVAGSLGAGSSANLSLGGSGAHGGEGGAVTVNSTTAIATSGDDAHALFAQSLGGGGGAGGFSVAASITQGSTANVALGGSGGGGGDGLAVIVGTLAAPTSGALSTAGARSDGILAQSVGGGGGAGGFSVAGDVSQGTSVGFSMGGSGGTASSGGSVAVVTASSIATQGDDSDGILAQSVGGGGGAGGFSVAGSAATSGSNTVTAAIGGHGGAGGGSDLVTVVSNGSAIDTAGERSNGILAQSVGGGGGNGGFSVAGTLSTSGSGAAFSLGGSGDHGGSAMAVSLDSSSAITTQGDSASGLFAQSLGGGGGSGGFSVAGSISGGKAADASIGGSGAGGGSAGTVTVGALAATTGTIITYGNSSIGLLAQSIGGGGGNGGFSVAGSITQAASAQFSLGGSAGTGSAAGMVVVDSDNSITTYGDSAHALFAQSLGGGGGNGGFSVAGSISTSGGNVGASIGGSGSGGGSAQTVTVTSDGAVLMTAGATSDGILAQSIGGGGGNGGFSVRGDISQGGSTGFSLGGGGGTAGNGLGVTVTSSAAIVTQGSGSNGIFAQSVGGGGGNGGFSVEGSISQQSGGLNASIGGSGAGGGTSADVTVTSSGSSISTAGDGADGIVAQSLGGGGGDGGFSVAGGISKKQSVNFSVGGSGDVGGSSGDVQVLNSSTISTTGQNAYGIYAQSVGGGGGNGGFSVAGSLFSSDTDNPTIDASLGGTGLGGGSAGAVSVGTVQQMVTGNITTQGADSYGIFAQSTGGGGGNGGFSVAGGLSKSPQVTFSVGGAAGTASNGGAVMVYTASDIDTAGDGAHAVFAQSLGGGGGNGGFSIAGSGTADVASLSASLGGQGGGGGAGGDVGVTNAGSILTLGSAAYGIYAQSIGGGGGNGGFSVAGSLAKPNTATGTAAGNKSFSLAIGGSGGNGDIGGTVTVTNSGSIQTAGDGSYAILAHSIGGGGGDGGFAATGSAGASSNEEGATSANIALSLGGNGGIGNRGGDVTVTNAGDILTQGADARGIYAYSVGGGGGNGGAALSFAVALGAANKGRSINSTISIGGTGGNGDVGGNVVVGNTGSIATGGNVADAIFAQSIGGGGGSGGSAKDISLLLKQGGPESSDPGSNWNFKASIGGNGGTADDAGTVMVTNSGSIATAGALSRGIFAQSVGGGGGDGADGIDGLNNANVDNAELLDEVDFTRDLHFTVGGSGGESGNGAAVAVTNTGSVSTQGFGSEAIFAQSVGGGGGIAQSFASGSGAGGTANGGLTGAFELGGGGGAAGYGDTVTVINSGTLTTTGDYADGIFAQSVGGGGGVAGDVQRGINLPFNIPGVPDINVGLGPALGQNGGSGGDGHAVTVKNTASISTSGVGSFGIFAQSVGGGGGVAGGLGNDGTVASPVLGWQNFYGSTGGSGNGGAVTVTQTGNITTTGATAAGIFAQSVATLGTGGDVTVTVNGNIMATGTDSAAVLAQSLGQQGSGNISVIIQGGTLQGGVNAAAGLGAAVFLLDGQDNTVENHGTLAVSDPTQFAVKGGAGNDAVTNFGTINGSIDLGAGTNAFDNRVMSTFNSGAIVNLGAGNALTNAGVLSPGGVGVQETTLMTGNLVQSGKGSLLIDVNRSTMSADHMSVTGTTTLAGTVNIIATPWLQSGHQQVTFLDSSQSLTTDTLQVVPSGSATVTYSLSRPDAHDLTLNIDTDYAATTSGALNANQTAFGRYLNAVTAQAVSTQLAPLVAQLQSTSQATTLATQFNQLTPEATLSAQSSTLTGNQQFSNALLSCRTRDGAYKFVAEGECTWFDVNVTTLHQSATADNFGFRTADTTLAGGVQTALGEHWHAGIGAAYDSLHTWTDGQSHADDTDTARQVQAGAVLKANLADTTAAVSVSVGHRDDHATRVVDIPQPGIASSDPSFDFYAVHLRLSHAFDFGDWYARPILDGGYTYVHNAADTETGAGAADLHVNSGGQHYTTLQPLVELGRQFDVRGGAVLRLFGRAGVLDYLTNTPPHLTASLIEAPQDIAPFPVIARPNDTWSEFSGGMDLISRNRSALRLSYSHLATSGATAAEYSLKFAIPID